MAAGYEINVKYSEYRPCYIYGQKALFHKLIEKDQVVYLLNSFLPPDDLKKIDKEFKRTGQLPNSASVKTVKMSYAIVELENGEVKEVDPTSIIFADNYINTVAFIPLEVLKQRSKENGEI